MDYSKLLDNIHQKMQLTHISFYRNNARKIQLVGICMLKDLEQLGCLRSEIPAAALWLLILVIHIRSQVNRRQSQSYTFKKITKI